MLRRVLRDSARAPAGGCPYDDTDPHMSRQAHHPSRTACYLTADPADKRKVVGVARARFRVAASAAEPREPRGRACAEGGGGRGPRRRPRRAWAPHTPPAPHARVLVAASFRVLRHSSDPPQLPGKLGGAGASVPQSFHECGGHRVPDTQQEKCHSAPTSAHWQMAFQGKRTEL